MNKIKKDSGKAEVARQVLIEITNVEEFFEQVMQLHPDKQEVKEKHKYFVKTQSYLSKILTQGGDQVEEVLQLNVDSL